MHAAYKVEYEALNRPNSHLTHKFCNSIGFLPSKSGIRDMSVCLSVFCHKETPILATPGPKTLPAVTCIPYETVADIHTGSLGQHSGSTEPCFLLSYATQPHPGQSLLCRGRYEQRNISQIGYYSASILTKVGSPCRGMARSAGMTNGVTPFRTAVPFCGQLGTSYLVFEWFVPKTGL